VDPLVSPPTSFSCSASSIGQDVGTERFGLGVLAGIHGTVKGWVRKWKGREGGREKGREGLREC